MVCRVDVLSAQEPRVACLNVYCASTCHHAYSNENVNILIANSNSVGCVNARQPKTTEGDAALSRTDFQWVRSQRGSTVCQLPHASNLPTSSTLLAHAFVYPPWSLRGLRSLLVSAQCSMFGCMPPLFSNAPSRASWGHAAWCIPRRTAGGGQRRFCSAHLRVSCTRSAGVGTGWARV